MNITEIQELSSCSANKEVMIKWRGRVEVQKTESNDAQTLLESVQ